MSGSHSQEGNYENTDGSDIHTLLDYSTRILFLVFMRGDVPPSTLQGEFEGVYFVWKDWWMMHYMPICVISFHKYQNRQFCWILYLKYQFSPWWPQTWEKIQTSRRCLRKFFRIEEICCSYYRVCHPFIESLAAVISHICGNFIQ